MRKNLICVNDNGDENKDDRNDGGNVVQNLSHYYTQYYYTAFANANETCKRYSFFFDMLQHNGVNGHKHVDEGRLRKERKEAFILITLVDAVKQNNENLL